MTLLLRACASLVLAAVLVIAGLYLAVGLHGRSELHAAEAQAARDIARALPESREVLARDRRTALAAVNGWPAPAYSWQELVCALHHSEGGLIVQDYYQECWLRSVDVARNGRRTAADLGLDGCVDRVLAGLDPDLAAAHTVRAYVGTSEGLSSADPVSSSCPDGVGGPVRLGVGRLVDGARPRRLEPGAVWTVLVVETPVSRTSLGCDPWAPIFCSEPVDAPVLEAPPA